MTSVTMGVSILTAAMPASTALGVNLIVDAYVGSAVAWMTLATTSASSVVKWERSTVLRIISKLFCSIEEMVLGLSKGLLSLRGWVVLKHHWSTVMRL